MRISELLSSERVGIHSAENGTVVLQKGEALDSLSTLLSRETSLSQEEVHRVLAEREALQSTGIGDGVAIPHGAIEGLANQYAALLIVPEGVDFGSIDNAKVHLLVAVVGPKRATGEHLKTLARISRLLRDRAFREKLRDAPSAPAALELIRAQEAALS